MDLADIAKLSQITMLTHVYIFQKRYKDSKGIMHKLSRSPLKINTNPIHEGSIYYTLYIVVLVLWIPDLNLNPFPRTRKEVSLLQANPCLFPDSLTLV